MSYDYLNEDGVKTILEKIENNSSGSIVTKTEDGLIPQLPEDSESVFQSDGQWHDLYYGDNILTYINDLPDNLLIGPDDGLYHQGPGFDNITFREKNWYNAIYISSMYGGANDHYKVVNPISDPPKPEVKTAFTFQPSNASVVYYIHQYLDPNIFVLNTDYKLSFYLRSNVEGKIYVNLGDLGTFYEGHPVTIVNTDNQWQLVELKLKSTVTKNLDSAKQSGTQYRIYVQLSKTQENANIEICGISLQKAKIANNDMFGYMPSLPGEDANNKFLNGNNEWKEISVPEINIVSRSADGLAPQIVSDIPQRDDISNLFLNEKGWTSLIQPLVAPPERGNSTRYLQDGFYICHSTHEEYEASRMYGLESNHPHIETPDGWDAYPFDIENLIIVWTDTDNTKHFVSYYTYSEATIIWHGYHQGNVWPYIDMISWEDPIVFNSSKLLPETPEKSPESKFLNGNREWVEVSIPNMPEINIFDGMTSGLVPPSTKANTIGVFKGATKTENGTSGLVPPPLSTEV